MRKFFLRIFLLLIMIMVMILIAEIMLPSFINKKIKEKISHKKQDIAQLLKIKIKSAPNLKMLLGKIDDLEIKGEDIKIGELNLKEIKGKLKDVSVDVPSLFSSRKIKISKIETSQIQMEIKEEDLQEYLRQDKDFRKMKIKLKEGRVEIIGIVEILGVKLPTTVEGNFRIEENLIRFVGKRLKLNQRQLPDDLAEMVLKKVNPVIDLSAFSLPLKIKEIEIKEGKIKIKGVIQSQP